MLVEEPSTASTADVLKTASAFRFNCWLRVTLVLKFSADGRVRGWSEARIVALSLRSSIMILKNSIHRCYCIFITLFEGKFRARNIVIVHLD
jgi:hypothetical protein